MRLTNKILLTLALLSCAAEATQYKPWFGNVWEVDARAEYTFQHFKGVGIPGDPLLFRSDNSFIDFSFEIPPWPRWDVELELRLARTRQTPFSYEDFRVTGRYLFLDDITGDFISLAGGATVDLPGNRFLHDFAVITYHGNVNAEFFVSAGKEFTRCDTWLARAWGYCGVGIANKGAPWGHGIATVELNWADFLQGGVYYWNFYGFGKKNIDPLVPFKGYAKIKHQAAFLGGYVCYLIKDFGSFRVDYFKGILAVNAPSKSYSVLATLEIPFSL